MPSMRRITCYQILEGPNECELKARELARARTLTATRYNAELSLKSVGGLAEVARTEETIGEYLVPIQHYSGANPCQ